MPLMELIIVIIEGMTIVDFSQYIPCVLKEYSDEGKQWHLNLKNMAGISFETENGSHVIMRNPEAKDHDSLNSNSGLN